MKRVMVGIAASLAVLAISCRLDNGVPPESNGSTDGRVHTCGYVTEQGVTEYLDAYQARCGIYAQNKGSK